MDSSTISSIRTLISTSLSSSDNELITNASTYKSVNFTTSSPYQYYDNSSDSEILCGGRTVWEDYPLQHVDSKPINILNITNELPINYARPLYGYVMPFLLVVTIVANTLIVVVLSKRHMRTPTNVVLMAMALCDMFTLLFPAPWLFYMYTFNNHYKPLSPVEACYAWTMMHEVSYNNYFPTIVPISFFFASKDFITKMTTDLIIVESNIDFQIATHL